MAEDNDELMSWLRPKVMMSSMSVAKGHEELDVLVAAKGHGELDELAAAKGHNELNELVVVKGKVGSDTAAKGTTANIFLPFSLTKYSAIVAEVEGYFGTEIGSDCACYLKMKDRNKIDNQTATVRLSLRI